jgi:hypothetical protein
MPIVKSLSKAQIKALYGVLTNFLEGDKPYADRIGRGPGSRDDQRRRWALDLRDRIGDLGLSDESLVDLARMVGRFPYTLLETKSGRAPKTWLRLVNSAVLTIARAAELPTEVLPDWGGVRAIADGPTDPTPDPAPEPEPLPDFNRDIPGDPDDETFPGMPDPTADPGPRIRIPSTKLPTMSRAYRPDPAPEPLSDDPEFSDPDRPTDSELAIAAGWDSEELAAGSLDGSITDTLDAHESLNEASSDESEPPSLDLDSIEPAPAPESRSEGNVDDSRTVPYGWASIEADDLPPISGGAPESGSALVTKSRQPFGAPGSSVKGSEVTGYTGGRGRQHTVLKSSDGRTILDARSEVAQEYQHEDGTTYALVFALPRGRWIIGYALGLGEMLFRGELRTDLANDVDARLAARDVAERLIELDAEEDARFDAQESDDDSDDSDDDEGPSDPPTVPRIADLDPFTRAYLEMALDLDADGASLDDIADASLAEHAEACRQFQESGAADLEGRNLIRAGQDFWLTRNGHGAGYWDGDYPRGAGRRLTDAAHAWGSSDAYVGDDGRVHLT